MGVTGERGGGLGVEVSVAMTAKVMVMVVVEVRVTAVEAVLWILATPSDGRCGERVNICGRANIAGGRDRTGNVDTGGKGDEQEV